MLDYICKKPSTPEEEPSIVPWEPEDEYFVPEGKRWPEEFFLGDDPDAIPTRHYPTLINFSH